MEVTNQLITPETLAEIEARSKKYRDFAYRAATPADYKVVKWFAKTVFALCRTLRAAWEFAETVGHRCDELDTENRRLGSENAALREQLACCEQAHKEQCLTIGKVL